MKGLSVYRDTGRPYYVPEVCSLYIVIWVFSLYIAPIGCLTFVFYQKYFFMMKLISGFFVFMWQYIQKYTGVLFRTLSDVWWCFFPELN